VRKRVLLSLVTAGALAVGLAGCAPAASTGGGTTTTKGGLIGVAMPNKTSARWIADGNNVKTQLEAAGFTVDLEYAQDDIPTQVSQVENMVTKGARALIIAAIDGTTLTNVLQEAADAKIKVIAYDRLIRDTTNVDYYATFDNFLVGQQQGWSVLNGLGLTDLAGKKLDGAPKGPFNIELFAGSPDDNNATFFFNGAMDVLQPYIDNKTLVVKSGQTDFTTVAILRWQGSVAQARMENLLTKSYSDGSKVNAVLSPYDGLSRGIISALKDNGYTDGPTWPIISGQDSEVDSVKAIIAGEQYASIFKDTRDLAKKAVEMTVAVLGGKKPTINNTKDYDNGKKIVPSFLLQPITVVKSNIQKVLVDSGYYKAADIGL
jgi:putative multiple sugar transport system substrate-binding protein